MTDLISLMKAFLSKTYELKLHILAALGAGIVFVYLIFPFDDLTDFVSAQIAAQTQNQIFAQFEGLDISIFPSLSAEATDAYIQANGLPFPIKADLVRLSPSLFALIRNRIEGYLELRGFYDGRAEVRLKGGETSERGIPRQNLIFDTEGIQIGSFFKAAKLRLPLDLRGQLNMKSTGTIDMTFSEQPQMEADLNLIKFQSQPATLDLQGMGLSIPGLKLSEVVIRGKLNNGRLELEQARFGKTGDDLQMQVKGNCALQIYPGGRAVMGQYSFDIDLSPSPQFIKAGGGDFLSILGSLMGKMDANPGRMKFNVSGEGMGMQPRFRNL